MLACHSMSYAGYASQEMYEMQEIPGEDDAVRGMGGQQKSTKILLGGSSQDS